MDKTIALIVTAAVLMMVSLVVITMSGSSLSGMMQDANKSRKSSVCQFQVDKYCNGEADVSDVADNCAKYVEQQCPGKSGEYQAKAAGVPVETF